MEALISPVVEEVLRSLTYVKALVQQSRDTALWVKVLQPNEAELQYYEQNALKASKVKVSVTDILYDIIRFLVLIQQCVSRILLLWLLNIEIL